jgi:hypothetical protein
VEPASPSLGLASQTSQIYSTNQNRSSIYVNTQKNTTKSTQFAYFSDPNSQ